MENISIPYNGSEVPKIAVCGYPVDVAVHESACTVAGLAVTAAIAAILERFCRHRLAGAHPSGKNDIILQ